MSNIIKKLSDDYVRIAAEYSNLFSQKRQDKNLTVRELGEKAGVSYTVIYDLEKRNMLPKVETLLKIAEALDFIVDVKRSIAGESAVIGIIFSEYKLSPSQESLYNPHKKALGMTSDEKIEELLRAKGLYSDDIKEIKNYINFKLSQH